MRQRRRAHGIFSVSVATIGLVLGGQPAGAAQEATAPGAPGALSHFDLARKDCLGTARNSTSKVWYTVAGGVLSDVYSPTVDTTNVETLQYVVTDGRTFTDLQTRDMTYTVRATDPGGMACQVTSTARSGRYRLVTDYVTDPGRDAVVMSTRLEQPNGHGRPPGCRSTSATTRRSTATAAAARPTAAPTTPSSTRPPPRWSAPT